MFCTLNLHNAMYPVCSVKKRGELPALLFQQKGWRRKKRKENAGEDGEKEENDVLAVNGQCLKGRMCSEEKEYFSRN